VVSVGVNLDGKLRFRFKQELSYRKQIAHQLRTQYIDSNPVTLKSRLMVTQGHWKLEFEPVQVLHLDWSQIFFWTGAGPCIAFFTRQ